MPRAARRRPSGEGAGDLRLDPAIVLALLERENPRLADVFDEEVAVVGHDEGPLHIHVERVVAPGGQHVGVYVEGSYCPESHEGGHDGAGHDHGDGHTSGGHDHPVTGGGHGPDCRFERFTRLLNASIATLTRDQTS